MSSLTSAATEQSLGVSPRSAGAIAEGRGRRFAGLPPDTALHWLVRLRWIAALGQLAALLVGALALELALPLPDLLVVVGLEASSNALLPALARRAGKQVRAVLAGALALDLLLLTALLALAGGPASHFSVLYLVPIALAALALGTGWGWIAVAASSLCYASLFVWTRPLPHVHDEDHGFGIHILGMWVATALAAIVIATVVGRIASALRARKQEVRALEARAARNERLVALSTLAAGTAHELGSPLATIAVAARELERTSAAGAAGDEIRTDAQLIRDQVERCRAILGQLGEAAGNTTGEAQEALSADELLERLGAALPPDASARLDRVVAPGLPRFVAPRETLARALQPGPQRLRCELTRRARPDHGSARWRRMALRRTRRGPGHVAGGAGACGRALLHHQAARTGTRPRTLPRSGAPSGSTSSACSATAAATSPRPHGCSGSTAARCSESSRRTRCRGSARHERCAR